MGHYDPVNIDFYRRCELLEPSYNESLVLYFALKNRHNLREITELSEKLNNIFYCWNPDFRITRLAFLRIFLFSRFGKNNRDKCYVFFNKIEHFSGIKFDRDRIINEIFLFYRKLTWLCFCTDHNCFSTAAEEILLNNNYK